MTLPTKEQIDADGLARGATRARGRCDGQAMNDDRKRACEVLERLRARCIAAAFELDALGSTDPLVERAIHVLTVNMAGAAIELLGTARAAALAADCDRIDATR